LSDPTFEYSVTAFRRLSQQPPIVIDLGTAREGFWVRYCEGHDQCRIRTGDVDVTFRFSEVAVYQRLVGVTHLLRSGSRAWRGFRVAQYVCERLLDESRFPVVVNPLMAGWSNGARPAHYRFLSRAGLRVPAWIVSNDPDSVRRFVRRHRGDVFVKSAGPQRTIARRFCKEHADALHRLPTAPVLFQKAIHGPDVRVHVVQDRCFGVRVCSKADDYRYPGDHAVEWTPAEVPHAIAALCVDATKQLGLVISGADFKICEYTGQWHCFEINPTPGYSYYDRYLDGRIASALTAYLQQAGENVAGRPLSFAGAP
jgi:hypothetical protein